MDCRRVDGRIPARLIVTAEAAERTTENRGFLKVSCKRASEKPARQIMSDMKWEGVTWLSSEDLMKTSGSKRQRVGTDTASVPPPNTEDALPNDPDRPPKPDDPEEERDDTRRSKDKDLVPSRMVWKWQPATETAAGAWALQERTRMPVAGAFFSYAEVPPKQVALLVWILNNADNPINEAFLREELVPRLNRTHPVSLRLLDWFVVDYAREKDVAYRCYVPLCKREINVVVHQLYSTLRDRWRRRRFDCFRRRHRVYFDLDGGTYSTTVAQLHFFFISRMYGFLDYAAEHLGEIEEHMKRTLTATQAAKQTAKQEKRKYSRQPLVKKAHPRVFVSDTPYKLSFQYEFPPGE
jgi:hypothetical protein